MRKKNKVFRTAAFFMLAGLIIMVLVMNAYDWDFRKLSTVEYRTRTYEIREDFSGIEIYADTTDLIMQPSEYGMCRVEILETETVYHKVTVENGTLTIRKEDERNWRDHIGISAESFKISIFLPKSEFMSISVRESTGDITLQNLSVGTLEIKVSTGDTLLENLTCKTLLSTGSTGDITLKNVLCAGKMDLTRSTGDIIFENADAGEITVQTGTGSVKGSLLTGKEFHALTTTGKIELPPSIPGGKCKIITTTGIIKITLK